jgi:hypothetical protein
MDGWVAIQAASGLLQANIIKGRLESEDIPVYLAYEAAGEIYAITVDGLGEVRILVPEEFAERARTVLAQTFTETDLDWNGGA